MATMLSVLVLLASLIGGPPDWDRSSLTFTGGCSGDCSAITATVCNTGSGDMAGETSYEVWYAASGNPKFGSVVGGGTVPALLSGQCATLSFTPSASGNYMFRALQRPGHPGTGELWSGACTVSCPAPDPGPGAGDPGPGTGDPGTGDPGGPGAGDPGPGTGEPGDPGTGDPGDPGAGDPGPGTGDPGGPGTGEPGDPGTGDPGGPGAGDPGPGTGESSPSATGGEGTAAPSVPAPASQPAAPIALAEPLPALLPVTGVVLAPPLAAVALLVAGAGLVAAGWLKRKR